MSTTETPDTILAAPEAREVLAYIRKIDANGFADAVNALDDCETEAEAREALCGLVRSRFVARCENESPRPADEEDKAGGLDRLDRAAHFSREAFLATLGEVARYALRDIHPEA